MSKRKLDKVVRWTCAAFLALIVVVGFALSLAGCSFVEGARDAALEEVTGTPSPGKPSGSSSADTLLYVIGAAIAGALGKHFIGKKKEPPA